MATYYLLNEQGIRTTFTALDRTFVDVVLKKGTNIYRKLPASKIGRPWYNSGAPVGTFPESLDDDFTGAAPTVESVTQTEIRFWAGLAGTVSGTTTSSSATITVASTYWLAVGQVVSGTGIPTGSTVAALPTSTTITLSTAATASGTVTLTFTSGPLVAAIWAKDYVELSSNTFQRVS